MPSRFFPARHKAAAWIATAAAILGSIGMVLLLRRRRVVCGPHFVCILPDQESVMSPKSRNFLLVLPLMVFFASGGASVAENPKLPDPLVDIENRPVTLAEWPQRRMELLEVFRREVYGRNPVERPEGMTCGVRKVEEGVMDGTAIRKRVRIDYSGPGGKGGFDLEVLIPAKRVGPVPCFLYISGSPTASSKHWHPEVVIARGYATAAFCPHEVDEDKDDGFKGGVHGIFDPPGVPRKADAWGTIAAWAWGASRCIDYLVTDADIDSEHIAVVGHSRYGKTALWCGAQDTRVALTISNNSGAGGAAVARGKRGERVANAVPYWFCANYRRWSHREESMPFDQHQLIALCAPRLVYVASATEDDWADPPAEFLGCVAASPVWKLHGLKGLEAEIMPRPEQPLDRGCIGYHLRTGKHALMPYDWERFIDFAMVRWKPVSASGLNRRRGT